ncbi:hypothetical protein GGX14DRAFT_578011 [Mycena pura]|uniref:Uncharacterized protein n=1 Tax=Mycena pura TaxID=153505 RepID=A0AAD6UUS5_9AGAR|nr:hypothetical protein GGX14DRAFT_578011 [Mycena pura]
MLDARPLPPPSLLPLNVMPFPNINDPASTSALDVEDEYLNSAAKMADPSTMVSTFSPCCIWRDDDKLTEAPARSSRPASTTRARPPPRHTPAARAAAWCQRGSGRNAGACACGLDRTARARAACTVISRAAAMRARVHAARAHPGPRPRPQARLAAHAPGPASPATVPERRVNAVQQCGLHTLQLRARGTAHPDDPIHASVYAGAEDLDVRPIHCFPDAPPFNIPETERKATRAPHRYRRGGTLWQQNTAAMCARMQGTYGAEPQRKGTEF